MSVLNSNRYTCTKEIRFISGDPLTRNLTITVYAQDMGKVIELSPHSMGIAFDFVMSDTSANYPEESTHSVPISRLSSDSTHNYL